MQIIQKHISISKDFVFLIRMLHRAAQSSVLSWITVGCACERVSAIPRQ